MSSDVPALRVLVAPNAFAGSLTASDAAQAMAAGIADAVEAIGVPMIPRLLPVSDGGPGLVAAVVARGWERRSRVVRGPLGDPVEAGYAVGTCAGRRTAVLELAEASGLSRLPGPPTPATALAATTYGTGELLLAALDDGAESVLLGLGGSATTDGGLGLLDALGVRCTDVDGRKIAPGGSGLSTLASIDDSAIDPRVRPLDLVLACDVDSPLLGPSGAAAMFAPQKGAGPAEVLRLAHGLARLADVLALAGHPHLDRLPHGGAAGGTAAGLAAVLGAEVRSGVDLVLDLLDVEAALRETDVVVTGEGSLDEQTLAGKAPLGVMRRAARHHLPVLLVVGQVRLSELATERLGRAGCRGMAALTELEPDVGRAMTEAAPLTRRATARLLARWYAAR